MTFYHRVEDLADFQALKPRLDPDDPSGSPRTGRRRFAGSPRGTASS